VHATSERAVDFALSPDERFLAFEELWNTYVTPFSVQAKTIEVSPEMKNLPVRKLSKDGGTYLSWSPDSRTIFWSLGPEMFSIEVDTLFVEKALPDTTKADGEAVEDAETASADDATDAAGIDAESERDLATGGTVDSGSGDDATDESAEDEDKPEPAVLALGWSEPADMPATDVWLVGGTILPMHELTAIDDGVIHVKGNRIVAIGSRSDVTVPANAHAIDVSGKIVMPGLVDIHAHTGSSNQSVSSQQNWAFLANLAFGVTTTHDPSNNSQMIFATSEMQKAGKLVGPRVFSTGTILYGAEGDFKTVVDKYEDAVSAVKRTAAWGAFSVKSYNQPRREQRQMVIKAARELGVMVVPEGGSTLQHNLNMIIDGHTTIEHTIPVAPLYDPALRLLSRFGTGLTPTLVVGYGGIWGENYWYQHTNVWEDERLLRFVPRSVVDPRSRRRVMAPEEEYHHFALAKTAAQIVHRGGNVQLGAHGQMQGIGCHWEIWMFEQGGMTPWEALRAATWMSARAIGLDGELGSLQTGLLADLIVIDGDPRENVRLSRTVDLVMVNGRLSDAATLEQIEPERRPLPAGPFLETVVDDIGDGCLFH
jgi:imidazolonepropionase-like amidohydrolase